MSGFQLGTSAFGRGTVYSGPVFTPAAQAAGSTGVANGQAQTISQRAFGITQSPQAGPRTAHYGSVGSLLLGIGILWFIWWSLPR
ncbi:MAG TPA: hypothetical protein VGR98_12270 [Streptosporangiaceae bacterium]|nr:hypothetical protein [Streptosporangiaceae bacterium]